MSNVDEGQILVARDILGAGLVSVQNRFSPAVRSAEPELRLCERLGLAFLPWSPLGGLSRSVLDGPDDVAVTSGAFHRIAAERGVSPQRIGLAWLLALSPAVVPIPGARRSASIRDSAAAADLTLTPAELTELSELSSLAAPFGPAQPGPTG
ncbi:aldo/keto reductase [Kitasatospora sp. NPDC058263]